MKRSNQRLRLIAMFALALMVGSGGCGRGEAAAAIALVKSKITKDFSHIRFYAGPLKGGTAVLLSDHSAFWVRNNRLHWVNPQAINWVSRLAGAPFEIDYIEVRMAVRGKVELDPLEPLNETDKPSE